MRDVILPKCEAWVHSREQVYKKLNALYGKGYRYVARDKDSVYIHCYSLQPKKYQGFEGWGYVDPDGSDALPAYPIKNNDIAEISWGNRSAMLIEQLLTDIRGTES